MMKVRITLTAGFLLLAAAGNLFAENAKPSSPAMVETTLRNTLWFGTETAAGLAFSPLKAHNVLDLNYAGKFGEYSRAQDAVTSNGISVSTSGALMLGKFNLWGEFSFNNLFEKGARFNCIRYEVPENMPYYLADSFQSGWNRQEYDLSLKGASPVLWDHVSFGLSAEYLTRVGAKQKDPRCETYNYQIKAVPSLAIGLGGGHVLGINGFFRYGHERSTPSINNAMVDQKVFITTGLGEYILGKVGGNDGQKTWFYRDYEYGGGIQYSYEADVKLLLNADFHMDREDATTAPKLLKRMGTSKEMNISGDFTALFGNCLSDRLKAAAEYSTTKGIEYVQSLNTEAFNQRWEVISENEMSNFRFMEVSLSYDHLFGATGDGDYDWKVLGELSYISRNYSYNLPLSTFDASSLYAGAGGCWNGKFGKADLLVSVKAGYSKALSGEYLYGGTKGDSELQNLYLHDIAFYGTDNLRTTAGLTCTVHARKTHFRIGIQGSYILPFGLKTNRILCSSTFGIIF